MKKHIYLYLIAAILVLSVAAGIIVTRPQPAKETPGILVTGLNMPENFSAPFSNPYLGPNPDVAQVDEFTRLVENPVVTFPLYTGPNPDVAQADEIARLAENPVVIFPLYTGPNPDVAQADEIARLVENPVKVFPFYTGPNPDVAQQDDINKMNP